MGSEGMYFSLDFSKSILSSVAPPGASQHLALLAFDVKEHEDAKAEVTISYKLVKAGLDSPVLNDTLKAKASEDSQDVISPLLQQAASAVLAQVMK
jgi:hypothetical protein